MTLLLAVALVASQGPPIAREQVIAALGGPERLADAASFTAEQSGYAISTHQGRDPDVPRTNVPLTVAWRVDSANEQTLRETHVVYPGGIDFHYRLRFDPRGGWNIDLGRWRNGSDLINIDAPAAAAERRALERQFPHLLLSRAAPAPGSSAGANGFVVTQDDLPVTVSVDPATGLPASISFSRPDGRQQEVRYADWRLVEGVTVPGLTRTFLAGELAEELRLTRFAATPGEPAAFRLPAGYSPAPAAGAPTARRLSDGTYLLEGLPGGYRSVAVIDGRDVSLIEAPLGDEHAAAQQALIETIVPGARVRQVILTHHHSDHVGGAGWFAERGARLIVPAGSAGAIRAQIAQRRPSLVVAFDEIGPRRPLDDRGRILLLSTPTAHAAGHLVAYLPGAQALYQGDLYYLPERGEPPVAFPVSETLSELIAAERLDVRYVIGTHGRMADVAAFRESLRRRATCSASGESR